MRFVLGYIEATTACPTLKIAENVVEFEAGVAQEQSHEDVRRRDDVEAHNLEVPPPILNPRP